MLPIFETVSFKIKGELRYIKGHHFAFIAPFSERVANKDSIPVALDLEGFDRFAFLEKINKKVHSLFFTRVIKGC